MIELDQKLNEARAALRTKEVARDQARKMLDQCEAEVAAAAAYLRGWEEAAALLRLPMDQSKWPPHVKRSPSTAASGRPAAKGRQVGAISTQWRAVLAGMVERHPGGATDSQIAYIGQMGEIPNLRPRDARRQMKKYQTQGFVKYHGLFETWTVTEMAAAKFDFSLHQSKAAADSPSAAAPEISSA
jgi:hypothetical protein